jgi:hypothetical protein
MYQNGYMTLKTNAGEDGTNGDTESPERIVFAVSTLGKIWVVKAK